MVYFVFCWFLLLTFFFYKRTGFSLCTYMFALYAISTFCSILIVKDSSITQNVPFNDPGELRFIPTFLYCILTPLIILPFRHINFQKTDKKPVINISLFNYISYFFILVSLISLLAFFNDMRNVLSGDLSALKDFYNDADSSRTFDNLPAPIQFILGFNILTLYALPFFFYSICFLNKSKFFNALLLLASLGSTWSAIIIADRTTIMFYLQMFICSYIIYRGVASKRNIEVLNKIFVSIFAVFAIYIVSVTISRFGEDTKYTQGGDSSLNAVIAYTGQGYLHFCYFYENANPNCIHYDRVFPITNKLIFDKEYADTREDRILKHGFFVGVFASALGGIMLDIGVFGMLIWVLTYFFFFEWIFSRWKKTKISLPKVLFIFFIAAIPIFGIFYYRYYAYKIALTNIVMLVICLIFKYSMKGNNNIIKYDKKK